MLSAPALHTSAALTTRSESYPETSRDGPRTHGAGQSAPVPADGMRYLNKVNGVYMSRKGDKRVDLIRYKPRGTSGRYSIGHFRIEREPRKIPLENVKPNGQGITFRDRDIDIILPKTSNGRRIRLALQQDSLFRLEIYKKRRKIWQTVAVRDNRYSKEVSTIPITAPISQKGFDRIRVVTVEGVQNSRISYIEVM